MVDWATNIDFTLHLFILIVMENELRILYQELKWNFNKTHIFVELSLFWLI
jgi:hypothetical protein